MIPEKAIATAAIATMIAVAVMASGLIAAEVFRPRVYEDFLDGRLCAPGHPVLRGTTSPRPDDYIEIIDQPHVYGMTD